MGVAVLALLSASFLIAGLSLLIVGRWRPNLLLELWQMAPDCRFLPDRFVRLWFVVGPLGCVVVGLLFLGAAITLAFE